MFLFAAVENVILIKKKPTDSDHTTDFTGKRKLTDPEAEVNKAEKQEEKSPVIAVFKKVHY